MQENSIIRKLTEARDLLAQYDADSKELEELSVPVAKEVFEEPVPEELPKAPLIGAPPKRGVMPWIILILSLAAAAGLWYYGANVAYVDYTIYAVAIAAVGLIGCLAMLLPRNKLIKLHYIEADQQKKEYDIACEEVEKRNEDAVRLYLEQTAAAEDAWNREMEFRNARIPELEAEMDMLQDKYMKSYSKLIPAQLCSIENVDKLIEILSEGSARNLKDAISLL